MVSCTNITASVIRCDSPIYIEAVKDYVIRSYELDSESARRYSKRRRVIRRSDIGYIAGNHVRTAAVR